MQFPRACVELMAYVLGRPTEPHSRSATEPSTRNAIWSGGFVDQVYNFNPATSADFAIPLASPPRDRGGLSSRRCRLLCDRVRLAGGRLRPGAWGVHRLQI